MSSDVLIRRWQNVGHITLNRPQALNALNHAMCLQIEGALRDWADDPAIKLVLLDGAGPRAFCAGGDIAQIAEAGRHGDFDQGRAFWRDEYRLNLMLHQQWGKPVVSFLHGFTMGGGVGLGGHVGTRVVGESSQIAMPECGIGLIPDVGGTWLLSQAPGALGAYLALTGTRMGAGDAIHAGFADHFIPEALWPQIKATLARTGDLGSLPRHPAPTSQLAAAAPLIDRLFCGRDLGAIFKRLEQDPSDFAAKALARMKANSPLSMASSLAMIQAPGDMAQALAQEFRWCWRAMEHGDFLEGVRAQILDKDRQPRWRHPTLQQVPPAEVAAMLAPLGPDEWKAQL